MGKLIYDSAEWSFDKIREVWEAIDKIGKEELKLDYYPVQVEVITAEQMIDCYASHAMPFMYDHWSFGKSFIKNFENYKTGRQGLAYEVVINTDPCIAYLMEDNTMTMQTLVLAHAGCGHNSFFKCNYMFKDWTDASYIIPYLKYAKHYIAEAEISLGKARVEKLLDACHSLQYHSVNKYKRREKRKGEMEERSRAYEQLKESEFNNLWRTIPKSDQQKEKEGMKATAEVYRNFLRDQGYVPDNLNPDLEAGEENILYFIEKHSIHLSPEEKEILRIVRTIAQYFYPQMQTQLMNEGWATFTHYEIMTRLEEQGLISPGHYLEFLESHSGVVMQPDYDSPYYSGINVYALGFAMFRDLKRICLEPTEEDIKWFPDLANSEDWIDKLQEIAYNFKDESFVLQYLSPKVIRDFKLFIVQNNEDDDYYKISGIHNDEDVLAIRQTLSDKYNLGLRIPNIEIVSANLMGSRMLLLRHNVHNKVPLEVGSAERTLANIQYLWGDEVELDEIGFIEDEE